MPTFTFTKNHDYREDMGDSTVTMTFTTDNVEVLRANFEDFLNGAGFVTKSEELSNDVIAEEDFMWDDAFTSKFGPDVISFNNFNLGGK